LKSFVYKLHFRRRKLSKTVCLITGRLGVCYCYYKFWKKKRVLGRVIRHREEGSNKQLVQPHCLLIIQRCTMLCLVTDIVLVFTWSKQMLLKCEMFVYLWNQKWMALQWRGRNMRTKRKSQITKQKKSWWRQMVPSLLVFKGMNEIRRLFSV